MGEGGKRPVRNFVCGITLRKGGWPTHRKRKEKAASRREWTDVAMDESARRHTRSVAMVNDGEETRVAEVRSDQRSASMRRCGDGSGDGGGGAASKAKAGGKRIQE